MGILNLFRGKKAPEYSIFPIGQLIPDGWSDFVAACLEGELGVPLIRIRYEPYDLPTRTVLPGLAFVAVRDLPMELRGAKPDDMLPLGHFQQAELNGSWRWDTISPALRVAFKTWLTEWTWVKAIHGTMGGVLGEVMHGHEMLPPGCGPDTAPRVDGKLPVYAIGLETRTANAEGAKEAMRQVFLDHALRVIAGSLSMTCPIGPDEGKPRLKVLFPSWVVSERVEHPDAKEPKVFWNHAFVEQRLRGFIDQKFLDQYHLDRSYEGSPIFAHLADRDSMVIRSLHEFIGRAKRG